MLSIKELWEDINIIEIKTDLPIDEAIQRLTREITPPSLFVKQQSLIGKISDEKISVRRAIPFEHYMYYPVFEGRLETVEGKTVLKGHWTHHWYSKVIAIIWCAFGVFFVGLNMYLDPISPISLILYTFIILNILLLKKYKFTRPKEDKEWIIKCFEYILNT